jgi:Sec-independent protein secretion pathway component TatC
VSIQIWLLYASLNNALENNREILIPAFVASLILFLIGFGWLYYLPSGNPKKQKEV